MEQVQNIVDAGGKTSVELIMNTISVLIVDDHPVVRQGIKTFLETHGELEVKGTAANGEEAIKAVKELQPDVVLMDIVMPGMDGIEALSRIKTMSPKTRVIAITSFDNNDKVFPAIKAGADGYLLKDVLPNDLVQAIKSVYMGKPALHPDIAQKLMVSFSNGRPSTVEELTPRESEVLELVACGLSNDEIADKLIISDKTVKTHVSNILHKLNLTRRTQAALYAVNKNSLPAES